MLDSKDLVRAIKKAAVEAVDAANPCQIRYGTVTSASPLKINVEQKMTLTAAQLVLTRNVKDFKTWVTLGNTETYYWTGSEENPEKVETGHKHVMGNRKQIIIHNALQVGEKVLLIREQGGQKYIVLDRV